MYLSFSSHTFRSLVQLSFLLQIGLHCRATSAGNKSNEDIAWCNLWCEHERRVDRNRGFPAKYVTEVVKESTTTKVKYNTEVSWQIDQKIVYLTAVRGRLLLRHWQRKAWRDDRLPSKDPWIILMKEVVMEMTDPRQEKNLVVKPDECLPGDDYHNNIVRC